MATWVILLSLSQSLRRRRSFVIVVKVLISFVIPVPMMHATTVALCTSIPHPLSTTISMTYPLDWNSCSVRICYPRGVIKPSNFHPCLCRLSRHGCFKRKFSRTARSEYLANTCPKCGVMSGDFYLHSEPGGPFFPTTEEGARRLTIEEIPLPTSIRVRAGVGMGTGDLILKYGKRGNA